MKLSRIMLKNYRCFEEGDFNLGKITLLMGANSSGKTSVISALLSAIQSEKFPLYFSPNGDLVETGDFKEISRKHSPALEISVGLEFSNSKGDEVRKYNSCFAFDRNTRMPSLVNTEFSDSMGGWRIERARGSRYSLTWDLASTDKYKKDMDKAVPGLMKALERSFNSMKSDGEVAGKARSSKSGKRSASISGQDGKAERNLSEIGIFSQGDDFWNTTNLSQSLTFVQRFRSNFCYLGSQRSAPLRTYYHSAGPNLKIGVAGQNTAEQILAWRTDSSPLYLQLLKNARSIGIANNIQAAKLAGGRVEIRIKTKGSSVSSSLADVGFGVNQLLPILVAELQHPGGATIAISQPETHLHPSVQAELASHFHSMSVSKGLRYIIETHSEYMINRFRRLIVGGKVDPKDIAAYHMEQTKGGVTVHRVKFEKDGRITGAPKDFFQTYSADVMGIALRE